MTYDQANQLRQLVRHEARLAGPAPGDRPALVTVTGGKGGVGTTTLAVNLAVALARAGHRTVLVDADLDGGDASLRCKLAERYSVADVLVARRTVREVLQPGPGGIQVVPGIWGLAGPPDDSPAARQRLIDGLAGLANQADFLVADAGNGLGPMVRSLWQAADMVLMVATPELPSVMVTYASIKALSAGNLLVPIHLLVNQAREAPVAEEVHGRIAAACLRFLAIPVTRAGHLPADPQVAACGQSGKALMIAAPQCPAALELQRLAKSVAEAAGRAAGSPHQRSRRLPQESVRITI
jgi:flagellar biosynthesis protein FlhG